MNGNREEVKRKILEVLHNLTREERKLFKEVYRIESDRLNEKNPNLKDELLKAVKVVMP